MVPGTHARRGRRNSQRSPRRARQLSIRAHVLFMRLTVHDISLRTNYTWGSQVRWIPECVGCYSHPVTRPRAWTPRTAMRASAFDPPAIPPGFWERAEVRQALRKRDVGSLFRLVKESAGLSNIRLGAAVGLTQGRIGEVINGTRRIAATHVFERIADGLAMPDSARLLLGLSPRHPAALTRPARPARARLR